MKTPMTRRQRLGLFAAALFPALWLLWGLLIWLLVGGILTGSFVLVYLIFPAAAIIILRRIIRSRRRTLVRWIACVLTLALTVFLAAVLMFWGHFSIYDRCKGPSALEQYESDIGNHPHMPETDALGEPERIEYHYFYNQIATFFDSECFTLICTYAPEDYAAMTAELDTRYTFHTEPLWAGDEPDIPPLYTLEGYEFRFLEMGTDTYGLRFPHYMVLVGTNDETREVVWSYYSDPDLDYISDPEAFLLKDCGWKYIR